MHILLFLLACDTTKADPNSTTTESSTGTNTGSLIATGEGPCKNGAQCEGEVCVALIDGKNPPNYCTQECDGGCPDGMFCDTQTFGAVGLEFCRFGKSEQQAAPPEEPPRLPCTKDGDCRKGEVCAEFQGEKSCTIPCDVNKDCEISAGGMTIKFMECGTDESKDRQVCLPNPDCFTGSIADFQSCYSF